MQHHKRLQRAAPILQTAIAGDGYVSLVLVASQEASDYKIFKSTSSGMYGMEDTTVSGSVYGYEVTGLTNGITYYFKVKATNEGEDSAASNEVSATPQAVSLPPIDEDEDEGGQNGGSDENDDSNSDESDDSNDSNDSNDSEPMPTEADLSSTGIEVLVNEQGIRP